MLRNIDSVIVFIFRLKGTLDIAVDAAVSLESVQADPLQSGQLEGSDGGLGPFEGTGAHACSVNLLSFFRCAAWYWSCLASHLSASRKAMLGCIVVSVILLVCQVDVFGQVVLPFSHCGYVLLV